MRNHSHWVYHILIVLAVIYSIFSISVADAEPTINRYYRDGERVFAFYRNAEWRLAKVIKVDKKYNRWLVHYTNTEAQADTWLTQASLRPIERPPLAKFPITHSMPIRVRVGETVFAAWHNELIPATIVAIDQERWRVHYLGYDRYWDEWIDASRLLPLDEPPSPVQKIKTSEQNHNDQ
jgi:hypothetical protein